MSKIVLESKKDQKGIKNPIVKDENGYYRVTLGAFNTFNNRKIYYRVTDLDKVVGPESIVGKRIKEGYLRAEYNHPEVPSDYAGLVRRTLEINPDRVCEHIKRIEVINTQRVEKGFNLPIYIIYGWVKPDGPYGKYIEDALNNPDINIAHSVRSVAKQSRIGSIIVRDIKLLSTWDYVTEPGYAIANQWYAAGLESASYDDLIIESEEDAEKILAALESNKDFIKCKDGECIINAVDEIRLDFRKERTLLDW